MSENILQKQNYIKRYLNSIKSAVSNLIAQNRLLFFLYVLSVILGITAGCVTYFISDKDSVNKIFSYMQNYFTGSVLVGVSFPEIFKSILIENLKLTLVLFISSLSVFLCPLSFIRLFSKGFGIGLTATFFLTRYMIKGIIFSALSVFICNVIVIPAIVLFAVYNTAESINVFRQSKKSKFNNSVSKQNYLRFLLRCTASAVMLFVIFVISALIQGFVCPGTMRIFYMLISGN